MNLCWNRYILRIAKVAMDRCLMRLWRILYVNCRKNVCNGYFFFGNIIFWCSLLWRLPNRNCVCVYVWMRCSFSPSTAAAPHQISFNWIKLNLFCLAWISVIWECRRESEKYHEKMTTHAFAGVSFSREIYDPDNRQFILDNRIASHQFFRLWLAVDGTQLGQFTHTNNAINFRMLLSISWLPVNLQYL